MSVYCVVLAGTFEQNRVFLELQWALAYKTKVLLLASCSHSFSVSELASSVGKQPVLHLLQGFVLAASHKG